jgi:hypothetical protein
MNKLMLTIAMPVIIGPLTFLVMQGAKAVSATIDALPATAKRIAVLMVASLLTLLGSWAGVDFNCDLDGAVSCLDTLDKDAVKAAIGAAIAFVLHLAKKKA